MGDPHDVRQPDMNGGTAIARCVATAMFAVVTSAPDALAQTPVTRDDAIATAIAGGPRVALARADTAFARAALVTARERQNPGLSATYSTAVPRYHFSVDLPLGAPGARGAGIGSARARLASARYRFTFDSAAAALDADTTYTRALAARERTRLSARNAEAAESLLAIARARRDAGDASDLEVDLAILVAGQAANAGATDSLVHIAAILDLQQVMGLADAAVVITPSDLLPDASSIDLTVAPRTGGAPPLRIAAARADLDAARLARLQQRRSRFGSPALVGGVETGDPSTPGMLPTFGVSFPLPLLSRNRASVRMAQADEARTQAQLALITATSGADIARARRELAVARERLRRDEQLALAAERVAARSLVAYREGAAPLPSVLEAQRTARDAAAQYVDDLAAAWIAASRLRVLTLTSAPESP